MLSNDLFISLARDHHGMAAASEFSTSRGPYNFFATAVCTQKIEKKRKPQPVANYALCINIFIPEYMAACEVIYMNMTHTKKEEIRCEILNGLATSTSSYTTYFLFVSIWRLE